MIAVLASMLRARWANAVTVFLLSVVAVAAAVAGPVSLRAVDAAIVTNEVTDASAAERTVAVSSPADPSDPGPVSAFTAISQLLAPPGFDPVRGGELRTYGPVPTGDPALTARSDRFVFRDQLCGHVVIVTGRCLAGTLDVLVGADTAARIGLHAGDTIDVQAVKSAPNGQDAPDGPVTTLTVAGIYRPRDLNELYWAAQYYFVRRADATLDEPVFTTPQTLDQVGHSVGASSIDFIPRAGTLTPDRLRRLPAEIASIEARASDSDTGVTVSSGLTDLSGRIASGQRLAHELVPVAFVPLVGLSWFVVFLAAAYGVGARRPELGLVALRGVRPVRRWSLALAETLLMVVLAAPVGYLVGYAVVGLLARTELGDPAVAGLDGAALPAAALSLAGALVVALLGQRQALREPVVELLRGVPRPVPAWRSAMVDAMVVVLAVLGVVQLRSAAVGLTGVALLVPGLVVVATTLLAARLFVPAVGALARTALRRGYLGAGLAAVQIARRPGSQRLFALLAVATGLLSFIAAGQSVAGYARRQRAEVSVGAAAVVTVARSSAGRLLNATEQADPAGTWAMAGLQVDQPGGDGENPPLLAVDTRRLAAVATWRPEFGASAAAVADALRAPPARPFVLRGEQFTVDMDRDPDIGGGGPGAFQLVLLPMLFHFESLADGSPVTSTVNVSAGRHTYTATSVGCAGGCRLTGFSADAGSGNEVGLTLFGISSPGGEVVPRSALIDQSRWRGVGGTAALPGGGGLRLQLGGDPFDEGVIGASIVDAPTPVPVVVTTGLESQFRLVGLDGRLLPARQVQRVALLPHVGNRGVLADLTYLLRVGLSTVPAASGQVWLGASAPADAVQRLRKAGLSILDVTTVDAQRSTLDRSGPALALGLHRAAAGLGIGLALGGLWLVASVDRRRRTEDLRALRHQGLRRRVVARAALWGYLWLVVGAALAGLAAAAVAWYATGDHLPVLTDTVSALPTPRWPDPRAVVVPWALAGGAMVAVALVVAVVVSSAVRRKG